MIENLVQFVYTLLLKSFKFFFFIIFILERVKLDIKLSLAFAL